MTLSNSDDAGGFFNTVIDPVWGYRRLEPLPTDSELQHFYETEYYELIPLGKRACELRRLLTGGTERAQECEWLAKTLWVDIEHTLTHLIDSTVPRLVLDIGAGTGDFSGFLKDAGWTVHAVEPARDMERFLEARGLFYCPSLEHIAPELRGQFSAITLINVLEHVTQPAELLQQAWELLSDAGIVVVRVPNDFNPLQNAARTLLNRDPWWIAVPDHVNYFDFSSLSALLEKVGFSVEEMTSDFPMEMFLLMGDDYTADPELGSVCHSKRRSFELSIPADIRRKMYRSQAAAGIGRNCLVFARKAL